jgi:hypothetical protein
MRYISSIRSIQPLVRAISVIASVAILVTGVTYAALQSQQATLKGNSLSTGTADLRIGLDSNTYNTTQTGFSFGNVIPGNAAEPAEGNSFYLKNFGSTTLALKAGISSTPANANNVDLSKTYITLTRVDTSATQKLALAALVSGGAASPIALNNNLAAGSAAQYKVQVSMDSDAFTGQSADITGIDLVFTGTAVTQ